MDGAGCMQAAYLSYLKEKVGMDTYSYDTLLNFLLHYEFWWCLESDGNRAVDGIELRTLYSNETGLSSGMGEEPCSVLEMFVALSLRIEQDVTGEPGDDHPEIWFATMLANLDILKSNQDFSTRYTSDVLDRWMGRNYGADGSGSLFPLRRCSEDQRLIPIWDQLAWYINENFYAN